MKTTVFFHVGKLDTKGSAQSLDELAAKAQPGQEIFKVSVKLLGTAARKFVVERAKRARKPRAKKAESPKKAKAGKPEKDLLG